MCQAGGETAVSLGPQEEAPNKTGYYRAHAGFDHGRAGQEVAPTARSERRTDPSKHSLRRCTHSALSKCVRLAVCLGAAAPEGTRRREGPRSRRAQVDEGEHLGVRRGGEPAVQRRHLKKKGGG